MNSSASISSWNQAIILWLYTNLAGMAGTLVSLVVASAIAGADILQVAGLISIVSLVGIVAAAGSLVAIPIARFALGRLLLVPRYRPRLAAMAAAVSGFFSMVLLAAVVVLGGPGFSLVRIMLMGGWAYLLAALLLVRFLYGEVLFRPDAPQHPTDAPA